MQGAGGYTTREPIRNMPSHVGQYFSEHADFLHTNLEEQSLVVKLDPAPDPQFCGHKIRVAYQHNPAWYSQLFHDQQHWRRDRTLRALDRIRRFADGRYDGHNYAYDLVLRGTISKRLVSGYSYRGVDIPPENPVRAYFGLEPVHQESLEEVLLTESGLSLPETAPF